jgi:hypothetical protein
MFPQTVRLRLSSNDDRMSSMKTIRQRFAWRRLRRALAVMSLVVVLACEFCYLAYPGFCTGLTKHLWYTSGTESMNLYGCVSYWLAFMEHLAFNERTQQYDFEQAIKRQDPRNALLLGQLKYHRGDFAEAIQHISNSIANDGETEEKLFWLALSYLRQAEASNCLRTLISAPVNNEPPAEVCTLPIACCHERPQHSATAAALFEHLLDKYDSENRLYQWLLNFCHMTTDTYPEAVPQPYRLTGYFQDLFYGAGAAAAETELRQLNFRDEAQRLGVDTLDTGRGVAVEDFDRDGYLDIVTGGSFNDLKFYRNLQGQRFENATTQVKLDGVLQPFCISAADYDNDGWVDLFVARPFGQYQLFRNESGQFRDVTATTGLLSPLHDDEIAATWISAWGDVDNDGDLDLFLAQWGMRLPLTKGIMARRRADSTLFLNERDATGQNRFVDKTSEFGLSATVRDNYFIGAAFGDYNRDGFTDLVLSSPLRSTSVILKNIEGRRFEPTPCLGRPEGGFVTAFVDVNHDGRLDVFQSGFGDARTSTQQAVFGEGLDEFLSGHSAVFVQAEDGTFREQRGYFDERMPMSTMGANYGDLNNDGAFDFYLGTGTPEGWFVLPNLMYLGQLERNQPSLRTRNVSMLNGFGTIQKGHGIVFFDFDEDGDQDIYSSLGGMWPGDAWPNQLFVNHSDVHNSWLKIRLRGRRTNYFGVGSSIKIVAHNERGEPIVRHYHMDNKTGFGSAPYLAHVGLLTATAIDRVEVFWPVSGQTRVYQAKVNSCVELLESEGTVP